MRAKKKYIWDSRNFCLLSNLVKYFNLSFLTLLIGLVINNKMINAFNKMDY